MISAILPAGEVYVSSQSPSSSPFCNCIEPQKLIRDPSSTTSMQTSDSRTLISLQHNMAVLGVHIRDRLTCIRLSPKDEAHPSSETFGLVGRSICMRLCRLMIGELVLHAVRGVSGWVVGSFVGALGSVVGMSSISETLGSFDCRYCS